MKIKTIFFPLLGSVLLIIFQSCTEVKYPQSEKPIIKSDIPGNPGWYKQWYEMRSDASGNFDYKLYRNVRMQTEQIRMKKGGGSNLTNIQEVGPDNVGGRTRAFLVDRDNQNLLFSGGISGGLWVSTNRGTSWAPVNDDVANLSITAITQNPFNSDILYYSGGEPAGNSAGIAGNGIYKSTDHGSTFQVLANSQNGDFDYVWKIEHSLVDSNTIYIATANDGLQRSTDGGMTFESLLTGEITDIEVFEDSSVIAGRHGSGIYYSPNGNPGTFSLLSGGLPSAGSFNRIEMAYCKNTPQVMYAAFENTSGNYIQGVYKTTNGGSSWTATTDPGNGGISFAFPWYCLTLAVKPNDPNYVVIGSVGMGVTNDGGNSWVESAYSHADNHIVVFDPFDYTKFYVGNDGGVYRYDVTQHWFATLSLNNGYNVTQFYTGSFFPTGTKYWGGTQDNGTQSGTISDLSFDHIFGGDGAFTSVNQQAPNNAFISWQNGHIYKTSNAFNQYPDFLDVMNELDGDADGNVDDDTWFINPFEMNRQDGEQVYFVTRDRLWRTIDGAASWEPATALRTDLYAIGISNEVFPVVYVGGRGKLFRMDNAIGQFPGEEISLGSSIPMVVQASFMSCITVSPNDKSTIYVSFSTVSNEPRIYKVTNATGSSPTWTAINGDLPPGLPINWIEVSPYNEDVMIIATDFGLYTTMNGGQNWNLEEEIPNVPVHMVRLRHSDNKLFIYTHGRGIWTANAPTLGMGTQNQFTDIELMVYPTITDNIVNVKSSAVIKSLELISSTGQILASISVNSQKFIWDASILANGIYYVRASHDNGKVSSVKFIKK